MAKKEDLAISLAETLNKQFKTDGQVAYFIGNEDTPTDVSEWLPTGSSILDLAISNRPYGGAPVGRIIELNGLEASGKSLIAAHMLLETQRRDGIAVYIDTETALSMDFLQAIGLDISKMLYIQLDTIESIFEAIESIINKIRESNKKKLVTIVLDSFAAATTINEREGDYNKEGWATDKAIIASKAFRKITRLIGKERICLVITNQLRDKLGVMFGDKLTTSGGKALGFYASVRIRLKIIGQIKVKTASGEQPIGVKVEAQVIKNRVGPPFRKAIFDVYFDRGIDDSDTWLEILKNADIVKRSNPGYKVVDDAGVEHKFITDEWSDFLNNDAELKKYLYLKVCDSVVMKYRNAIVNTGMDLSDLQIDDSVGESVPVLEDTDVIEE